MKVGDTWSLDVNLLTMGHGFICDKATRILGSYGYAREFAVQRYFRDIRFTLYGGGTSEIIKLIIAKELSS